jgi:hypothetical protein
MAMAARRRGGLEGRRLPRKMVEEEEEEEEREQE